MKKSVFILFFFSLAVLSAVDISVNVSDEEPGENCPNGGVRIDLIEGDDSTTQYVCNGENGSTPAVSVTDEPAGVRCPAGGIKIVVGTETKYVCNGQNGENALVRTAECGEGECGDCVNGGVKIEAGIDNNPKNNILDDDEVDETKYVCAGSDGNKGRDALVKVSDEPKGANCTKSTGIKIEVGIDDNGNGTLDESEVTSTQYVCNGKDGSQGPQGAKGEQGEPGVNGSDGQDGEQGEKGEQGPKGDDGLQGETGATGENGSNGATTLVSIVDEPKGENCVSGGKKIETGLDANGNGALDEDEVDPENVYYVCNGMDAEEAGLTSSSTGCAMTSLGENSDWIYAVLTMISMFFAAVAIKLAR